MFDTDALLRQMDHLSDLVQAYREGTEAPERIERQLDALTGLSVEHLSTLLPHQMVPPLDDPRRRRVQAMGIADALHALGHTAEALRLIEVATTWRADDELEAERQASWGTYTKVHLGAAMTCARDTPRSLALATERDLGSWQAAGTRSLAGGALEAALPALVSVDALRRSLAVG